MKLNLFEYGLLFMLLAGDEPTLSALRLQAEAAHV